jgi:FKBP-type peptidyl-prolyl cis-trans isomerase 2
MMPAPVIDSSNEREPLVILFGHGAIIPGSSRRSKGHAAGDRFDVVVPPEQAYGLRRDNFTQRVPKKYFQDGDRLQPGMSTGAEHAGRPSLGNGRQGRFQRHRRRPQSSDGRQDAALCR